MEEVDETNLTLTPCKNRYSNFILQQILGILFKATSTRFCRFQSVPQPFYFLQSYYSRMLQKLDLRIISVPDTRHYYYYYYCVRTGRTIDPFTAVGKRERRSNGMRVINKNNCNMILNRLQLTVYKCV